MGKGSSAPDPDPQIGEAARLSAKTGQDYLKWMQEQAKTTNAWAGEDRARYRDTFIPLENAYIDGAQGWDSPARRNAAAREAAADVRLQGSIARAGSARKLSAMGVDPRSGRYGAMSRGADMAEALAGAGAGNMARRRIEAEGEAKQANAINLGKGLAVNPGTSMQISNGAMASGANGAMAGYSQQGSLLNTQYQGQLASYNAGQQAQGMMGQAIGTLAGAYFLSDEEKKEKRRKVIGILDAVRSMPVDKWKYRDGEGDGGEHIGPMAQDFQRATGLGNGREIGVIDALGVTMGAVKELADKVDEMAGPKKGEAA